MTRKPTRRLLAALTVVAVAAAVAAPTFAMRAASEAKTVKVTLTEFAIKLNVASVPAGTVTFKVTNKGALPHDFEIAGKETPLLKKGGTATLKVKLKKGKYPYVCDVEGHPEAGMKGTLRVV